MRSRPVLAAMAAVTAAVVTLGTFARAGADDELASPQPSPAPEAEADPTPDAAPSRLAVEAGMSSEVNSVGTRHTSVGAVVTNPHVEAAYGVDVVFQLKDGAGAVVDTATERVNYLAGRSSRIVAPLQLGFGLAVEPAAVDVEASVTEFAADAGPSGGGDPFRRPEGARLEVVGPELVDEEYVSKVTGNVVNTTAAVAQFSSLHCVLRSDGAITGGASGGLSAPIGPGATLTFDNLLAFAPEGVDDVDCEAHASP